MKNIPNTENMPVLRTDFSDDAMWQNVCDAMAKSYHDWGVELGEAPFDVTLDFISDPEYSGLTPAQVLALIPLSAKKIWHSCIFIVDHTTITEPEHPVIAMDLHDDDGTYKSRGRTFRILPSQISGMEINLTLANMDFRDFADAVDADGVLRD